jgi:hypothetical protein
MLADKHKIEKEQNNQLRDQISRLLEVEQEQKIKMRERDLTIQSLQVKCYSISFFSIVYLSSLTNQSLVQISQLPFSNFSLDWCYCLSTLKFFLCPLYY